MAIALQDADQCEVDLHWHLGIHRQEMSARDHRARRAGQASRHRDSIVSPADSLVLTAHHSMRENLSPDTTLRDLLDVETWCERLAASDELEANLKRAVALGSAVPLLALAGTLAELNPTGAPASAKAFLARIASREELAAAQRLASLFPLQVRNGPLNRDLSYLVHPRSARQILGSLLLGWRRHRRVMQSMEEKATGQQQPLFGRLRTFSRSLPRLDPAQFRAMRTLAQVKDSYLRQSDAAQPDVR